MSKLVRRTRYTARQPVAVSIPVLIGKGVLVSLGISVILTVFLSIFGLLAENIYIDQYLQYIMVAVTMLSIFAGSAYAAQKAGAKGLVIGVAVGVLYVIISVGIGMEINKETISLLVLANKFGAGIAAGALGGLVGVNL
ncbi:MAG: TIGR04086 family membrane protein [Negativicutes bacterium]|nr:TIGR04086 family membrane protein [Negativicutes bacterium]